MTEEQEILLLKEITSLSIDDPKYFELAKQLPMTVEFALSLRDVLGVDYIKNSDFNYELVEAEYGNDWYTKEINL